jgi:lipopolysaccharide/colanic/teichoic acid biosynthesis glycosyltransferase/glycosyltransferase involved in cell wall biosynthesis
MMPKSSDYLSIIVPAHNAEQTMARCLKALACQTIPQAAYEVIVVDDGSTDRTAEIACQYGARLAQRPNAGPAAARNRGAEVARGEILLFTDADCAPAPDWIERMTEPFRDSEIAGTKGVYRTRQNELVARFVQLEYEDKYARMRHQDRIDFVDSYSAAYRRETFLANGGFDPLFPTASVEDQEFSFRLARKGYRLVFVPQAAVYHLHDTTLRQYWQRKFGIGYWKALLLRWHPDRAIRDSHTPQILKAQIGLIALFGLSLLLAPFWVLAKWFALSVTIAFAITVAPFLYRVIGQDPVVAVAAPFLLIVRALALGTGLVTGFLRFARRPNPHRPPIGGLDQAIKRAVDVAGSLAGLLLTAPVLAALAAAIRLDSPGPVLFVQERVGKDGRPFRMLKFRTMVDGAEEMLPALVNLESLPSPAFKLRSDPRITRLGRFLRRSSLDELPQFWNVLRGDMSLVGPRPEEARVVHLYSDWHRQRLAVKPGLTGPMQVNGRGDLDLDERVRLELDYIQSYSLWRDIVILARTIATVISGRGAY